MILRHRKVILTIATFIGMAVALDSPPAIAVAPWTEQARLADFETIGDVAVDGNLAAVGKTTSVIVYRRSADGSWTQEATLPTVRNSQSVAVDSDPALGEIVIIGDLADRVGIVEGGAVFIYTSNGAGTWSLQETLRPTGLETGDQFGRRIAFDGQTLAVSAPGDDDQGTEAGAVYVFERAGWARRDKILPPSGRGDIRYGWAVDVSDDRLVVGAERDDSVATDAGTVFVYGRQPNQTWAQLTELAGTGVAGNFFFGRSVAVEGSTVIVGTPGTGAAGFGEDPRSAYVFVENGSWTQQTILQPTQFAAGGGQFGSSVDISGNTVVVGAFRGNSLGFGSGSAWVFGRSGANWSLEQELTASDGAANQWYGSSVAIDGATVVAAAGRASYVSVGGDYVFPVPPQPEVSVRAIEVTQAVQDWNNTVTLIEGKTTVVRAFVELLPGEVIRTMSARLYGRRGSETLPASPLAPINGGVTIDTDIESRRGILTDSFNFRLPTTWPSGDVNLELVLVDTDGEVLAECNEPGGASPDCAVSVSFDPSETLPIRIYGVPWKNENGVLQLPVWRQLAEQLERLRSAYPLAQLDTKFWSMPPYDSKPVLWSTVASDLETLRATRLDACATCNEDIRYYGVLVGDSGDSNVDSDGNPSPSGGYALGKVASGFADPGTEGRDGNGYSRNRSGHELAHTLGISHTVDATLPLNDDGYQVGSCGSKSGSEQEAFPNHDLINESRAAVIGPLDAGADSEIWGFDVRYLQDDTAGLAVINPRVTPAMMSYCGGGAHGRWMSAFNYERLISAIADPGDGSGRLGGDGTYLFVSGVMDADGTTVQDRPVIQLSGTPVLPIAGADRVALNDTTGTELAAVDFEPIEGDTDAIAGDPNPGREQRLFFIVPLPKPASPIAEIIVSNNGVEISRVTASLNPPAVVITQPTAGQNLDTDLVTLAWLGSDVDGDPLTYTVQFSPDGGLSWRSLAANTPAESVEMERTFLTASTDALIRVAVSDGVNTSMTTSDRFTIANNVPLIQITQPATGLSFATGQVVVFEAFGHDSEDGSIGDASISWDSDADGPLGLGRELMLNTLTTGVHTITSTAIDSVGAMSSDSIVLGIGVPAPDVNEPPVFDPLATVEIDEGVTADIPITATDGDGDFLVLTATGVPGFGMFVDEGNGAAPLSLDPGFEDAGSYPVILGADDGEDSTELTVVVTVRDVNRPPTITPANVEVVMTEGATQDIVLTATDDDGDALSFAPVDLPNFASLADDGNGTAILTLSPAAGDAGASTAIVSVSDGDLSADASVAVTVEAQAPGAGIPDIADLSARSKSGKIQLVWTDVGASSYNIYRSLTSGGPYSLVGNTTSRYSTFLDSGLLNGLTYYYVVRPVNNGDEISQSNEAGATPTGRARRR